LIFSLGSPLVPVLWDGGIPLLFPLNKGDSPHPYPMGCSKIGTPRGTLSTREGDLTRNHRLRRLTQIIFVECNNRVVAITDIIKSRLLNPGFYSNEF